MASRRPPIHPTANLPEAKAPVEPRLSGLLRMNVSMNVAASFHLPVAGRLEGWTTSPHTHFPSHSELTRERHVRSAVDDADVTLAAAATPTTFKTSSMALAKFVAISDGRKEVLLRSI